MSLNALHSFTSRLPNLAWRPLSLENGDLWNTERSMMRGVAFAETGALLNLVFTHGIKHVFLSGGDAEHLSSLLLPVLEHAQLNVETTVVEGLETLCLLDLVSSGYTNEESAASAQFVRPVERRASSSVSSVVPASAAPSSSASTEELAGTNASEFDEVVNSLSRSRRKRFEHEIRPDNLDEFRRLGARLEHAGVDRRLDQFLAERFKFHSRDEWRRRILAGEVCIQPNAPRVPSEHPVPVKWVKHTYRTNTFDQIWFFHPQHHEPDMVDRCDVIADDGDVVVFSKPGNMVIHAVGQYSRNTFLTVASRMGYADAAPIHRIDRETSGILVCARSVQNRRVVADAFREGLMQKMYLAVTRTNPSLPIRFRVESTIGEAVASKIRLKLWVGGANAVSARTHFVRLSEHGGYSLYACFPKTGRTNQIRIHLASVGAWIVGDKMYYDDEEIFLEFFEKGLTERVLSAMLFPRHMLHNAAIRGPFELPKVLSENAVICPLPADFLAFEPLLPLLELAKIPQAADEQAAVLSQIFDEWSVLDFNNEPVV
jgi:23S rRNA pseudouridine1911/1915/1917 synthase